ncbi:MAG: type II secretion system inner membrane protein GspF [Proteobacteria bacterium]|nr:type II secretion system inner membrane protein GspF [Pseudomonadota bacterium]MBU1388667.1 type II secretion system inner membrane protein GspF [Pseudomonadota bacterium]MBU1544864.1 type II secretion system inner membrane protein GspF [Pseudomonadota bacterium]MBU2430410.1 type II secretion system inner membrane protein GspF [Pseudomonadota bacterium]MBU2480217.1 type II secretion system inner membrane protein GspF [Pseudomonadota bacterium]
MAVFEYKALNTKGKKLSGIIDAESISAAKNKLRQDGIYPTALNRVESHSGDKSKKKSPFFKDISLFSSIKSSELSMITRQLSTLLSAGFPLVKAVGTLIPQSRSKIMKKVLSRVKDAIEEGSSFANALALYPNVFSPIFINMVNAGESSGTLEIVLERLADFNENKEASKNKVQAALAYPMLMTIICLIILTFMMTYVVPGIVTIFTDMNQTLPLPTIVLISVSSFFKSFWWAIAMVPFIVFFIFHLIRKTKKGAYLIDRIIISLPLIGPLLTKIIAARFTRTLGSLLENGVPMLTALKISRTIAGNLVINELINTAYDAVEQGKDLGDVLTASKRFPGLASQMIKIGEASGELEKMLLKTAELYEKEIQTTISALSSLIEPLIILVMGIVVAGIILSICLPIFEINQLIQ